MNRSAVYLATSLFVIASISLAGAAVEDSAIRIVNGKLFLGDKVIVENFSITQSKFSYLFIYAPGTGLITLSDRDFPGAYEAGSFNGSRIEFELDGLDLRLEADAPILSARRNSVWGAINREFSLSVNTPIVGYGDDLSAPQTWQEYVHSDR